jgi:hypothetical protein
MYSKTPIEAVFKRDRIIVISGIAVVSVLAWMYMLYLAWGMKNLDMSMEMSLPQMQSWGAVDFSLMVHNVDGNDGGHDGPLGHTYGPNVCQNLSKALRATGAGCVHGNVLTGLFVGLGLV